jgi:hypothetical protein
MIPMLLIFVSCSAQETVTEHQETITEEAEPVA